jgi:hypothetical protein
MPQNLIRQTRPSDRIFPHGLPGLAFHHRRVLVRGG